MCYGMYDGDQFLKDVMNYLGYKTLRKAKEDARPRVEWARTPIGHFMLFEL